MGRLQQEQPPSSLLAVAELLLATDAAWIFDEISAALSDENTRISRVSDGRNLLPAAKELDCDLVICDMQIGSMGGMAACRELRLESGAERLKRQKVLLLLDREADTYLARQAGADGWLIKPLDAYRLRKAAGALLKGDSYFPPDVP